MKKVLKFLLGVVVTLYLACAVILTAFLLNYNEYNITVMFDNSLIIVEEELKPYKEGDLLAVKMNDISEIENIAKAGPIAYADYYIDNNKTVEDFKRRLDEILNNIKEQEDKS